MRGGDWGQDTSEQPASLIPDLCCVDQHLTFTVLPGGSSVKSRFMSGAERKHTVTLGCSDPHTHTHTHSSCWCEPYMTTHTHAGRIFSGEVGKKLASRSSSDVRAILCDEHEARINSARELMLSDEETKAIENLLVFFPCIKVSVHDFMIF